MTKFEFAEIMAYVATAIGKPVSESAMEVYFDLLGDVHADVLKVAAKRVVLEHKWSTFPTVAELRAAVAETLAGEVKLLEPGEAWGMAWAAVSRIDPEVRSTVAAAMANLPDGVAEAMKIYGINALCYGTEPVGVIRGQFMKIYEQVAARKKRELILPPALRQEIRMIGADRSEQVAKIARRIGVFNEDDSSR